MTEAGPVALPSTLAGERTRWLLGRLGTPAETSEEELRANLSGDDPEETLAWLSTRLEGFAVVDVEEASSLRLTVRVGCPDGREWDLTCTLADTPPHPIASLDLVRALPSGMDVRPAGPEDNEAILAVSRQTPVVLGDASVTIDLAPDFFSYVRLMETSLVMVATDQDAVVGVHCGAIYPVRIGGESYRMGMVQHSRISPGYAGLGLWSRMNSHLGRVGANPRDGRDDPSLPFATGAYIAVENHAAHRIAPTSWTCRPFRVTLPCRSATNAGRNFRPATPADAESIVEIINGCHEGEELFLPYTPASLHARLTRAPDLYSWDNLLLGEGAVVGIWHAGQRRTRVVGDDSTVSVRGLVLDYGSLPGHEDELAAILDLCCQRAADRGMTHLSIFTSDPSPGSAMLRSLGDGVEPYELVTPRTAEPAGVSERGVYVDQIYF